MSAQQKNRTHLRTLVLMAVFAALAFVTMSVFRFNVQFLTFDLKDAVITLAGLLLGPAAAFVISLLVATLEFITVSDTGVYGFLMNFASSAAFSVACALVYPYRKKLSGALLSLGSGLVTMVAMMLLLNLVVTPRYMGVSTGEVAAMIPTLFLPFNVVKGVVNAALVLILYKPVHRALIATRLLPGRTASKTARMAAGDTEDRKKKLWVSIGVPVGGVILLAAAIAVFYFVMGGKFEFL